MTNPYSTPQNAKQDAYADPASPNSGPLIIAGLVVVLLILHQDNWFWNDGTLVLGFMPVGLFFHACISIAAAATWFLATKIAWPAGTGNGRVHDSGNASSSDKEEA